MAAKAALIGATKHAGVTLAKDGVLVNSIAPGSTFVEGGGWDKYQQENSPEVVRDFIDQNMPMGRFGWPEPLGDLVAFLALRPCRNDHGRLHPRRRRPGLFADLASRPKLHWQRGV